MRLTVVSDIHDSVAQAEAFRQAAEASDACVACGDFTTFGDEARIQAVADALAPQNKPRYFVIGNCDRMAADGVIADWQNLHGRVIDAGEWLFAGLSGSLPCPSHTPSEFPESAFERLLGSIRQACVGREDRLILVSHQPPFDTGADQLPGGRHVGCRVLRRFIDEVQPACCLTGHIHEGASRSTVGRTVVLNPGPFAKGHWATIDL